MSLSIHNGMTVNTFLILTLEHAKPKSNCTKLLILGSYTAEIWIILYYVYVFHLCFLLF